VPEFVGPDSSINFIEGLSRHIAEFTCFDVRIALTNHLFGVIQVPGGNCVTKGSDENFTHPPATAVRCEIVVFRMVDIDLRGRRESLEN
jgi:hypothetical protein